MKTSSYRYCMAAFAAAIPVSTPAIIPAALRAVARAARASFPAALLALPLLLAAPAAQAQVYKWIDADGKTQFSDSPPPEAKQRAKPLTLKGTDTSPAAREEAARRAQQEQQRAGAAARERRTRESNNPAPDYQPKSKMTEYRESQACNRRYYEEGGKRPEEAKAQCGDLAYPGPTSNRPAHLD
jgi:hypothetical protein